MKKCPYCGKEYPDEALICPVDQQPLQQLHPPPLNRPSPTPLPAPSGDARRIIDDEHLKMLSIFHYVLAGLSLAGILFLCLHFLILTAVLASHGVFNSHKNPSGPPLEAIVPILLIVYLIVGGIIAIGGVLNFLSAGFLRRRKHRTFSLVVAALNCLHIPFGTVLGVFTFVVLSRPSVCGNYAD